MRVAPEIVLTSAERAELMRLVRSKRTSVRLEQRAGMILLAADGLQNKDIAEVLGVGRIQVARWRERYAQGRLAGIERDLPRGAPPVKVDVARLVELTTQSKPEAATHWSTRTMAAELGVSAASVSRYSLSRSSERSTGMLGATRMVTLGAYHADHIDLEEHSRRSV